MTEQAKPQLTPEERKKRIRYKKRRKVIVPISRISFLVLIGSAIALVLAIYNLGFIPEKYIYVLSGILVLIVLIMGIISLAHHMSNAAKVLQSLLCLGLSAGMIFGSIKIPEMAGTIKKMFVEIPDEAVLNINVYTLEDSEINSLADLGGRKLGIQKSLDQENQEYGLLQIKRETLSAPVETVESEDIYGLADDLLAGKTDAFLLNESFETFIDDNPDYEDFFEKTKVIYTCYKKVEIDYDLTKVGTITEEPFIVGVLGNDEWGKANVAKTSGFRTDVNIVMAVNPKTKQVLLVTLPRDSYIPAGGYTDQMDKLTHTTVYNRGISEWNDTIKYVLKTDINYTFKVNFSTITNIVDALGGVDINNPYEFKATAKVLNSKGKRVNKTVTFKKGNIHLNGDEALAYCRERKSLSGGDLARNEHQAIIIKALINKVTSPDIVNSATDVLNALSGQFLTNMDVNEMLALAKMQIDDPSVIWDIQTYNITGSSTFKPCFIMGNRELSVVILNNNKVNQAITYIQQLLANEVIQVTE